VFADSRWLGYNRVTRGTLTREGRSDGADLLPHRPVQHSDTYKSAVTSKGEKQTMHMNLARRAFLVLAAAGNRARDPAYASSASASTAQRVRIGVDSRQAVEGGSHRLPSATQRPRISPVDVQRAREPEVVART